LEKIGFKLETEVMGGDEIRRKGLEHEIQPSLAQTMVKGLPHSLKLALRLCL